MSGMDYETSIGFLLSDTARLLRKRFDQRTKALGSTRAQWRVLFWLARHPGINQARLAEILEVEPITLCRLLDRLEQAGLVRRDADPSDRRARLLFNTAATEPLLTELRQIGCEIHGEVLEGLDREEIEAFVGVLARIREKLSDQRGESEEKQANRLKAIGQPS